MSEAACKLPPGQTMSMRHRDAPPPERSFWEVFPKRSLRRVIFLVALLLVVIAFKRSGGGTFRRLLDLVGPSSPRPTGAKVERPGDTGGASFQHMKVVPQSGAGGGPP